MKSILSLPVVFSCIWTVVSAHDNNIKSCTDYKIPVTVTSTNYIWALGPFNNNFDVVDFITNVQSRTAATDFVPFNNKLNQTASYTIAATFCTPTDPKAAHKSTVLLASHGLGFDRSYWNPSISPEKYSFVDHAIEKGYSIFFYDRLGVGESSIVSGFLNQASIQVAILQRLAHLVRAGKYTDSLGVPQFLALVGHSFGSQLSAAAAVAESDISDGLILTGVNYNATNGVGFIEVAQPRIASTQAKKWKKLDSGYITPVDIYSNVEGFFKKPDYELAVVEYAFDNRQPFATTEVITSGLLDFAPTHFKGAALLIAGQNDLIFCTSQCDNVIAHPSTEIFSQAKAFKAVSYPGAGHGLNFAANATGAFDIITDFLGANGL